jgi:hypothetical protein
MIPVESGEEVIRVNGRGGKLMYDIFDNIARTCLNDTMYPHPAQQ